MIRVDIKALKAGLYDYDWDPRPEELDLDPDIFSQLHVHARLDCHPSRIFVTLHARGVARLECDRTLVPFDQPLEGEYSVLFTGPDFFEGKEDEEGVRLLLQDDEEIDLTEDVRDTLLLAVPQRHIAPGAEEEDIPMQFGRPDKDGETVDPRWEALLALRGGERPPAGDH